MPSATPISARPGFASRYTARWLAHVRLANEVNGRTIRPCESAIMRNVEEGSFPPGVLVIKADQFVPGRLRLMPMPWGGGESGGVMSPETMKYRIAPRTIGTAIATTTTMTMMRMIFPPSERGGGA
jgi:hypothetical protein